MKRIALRSARAILALIVATSSGCTTYSWTGLNDADLPARVRAVRFSGGKVLDSQHSMTWGQWTVSWPGFFTPEATLTDRGAVRISSFNCSNPVEGQVGCDLWLSSGRMICGFQPMNEFGSNNNRTGFLGRSTGKIDCPTDLVFDKS